MSSTERKKPLSPDDKAVCARLKAIWDSKQDELGLKQEAVAAELGIKTQGGVNHYLAGRNKVGFEQLFKWAQVLRVHPYEIDPDLRERLPGDLRLAVDTMLVHPTQRAMEAYKAITSAALALHEKTARAYLIEDEAGPDNT